ncbi:MAG: hypothetical protein WCC27_17245 [Acidobacteriaceae bacterium]
MRFIRLMMVAAIATLSASAPAQTGQVACEQLRSLHSGSLRILTADYSAAGEFRAPAVGLFNPPPVMLAGVKTRTEQCAGNNSDTPARRSAADDHHIPRLAVWVGRAFLKPRNHLLPLHACFVPRHSDSARGHA